MKRLLCYLTNIFRAVGCVCGGGWGCSLSLPSASRCRRPSVARTCVGDFGGFRHSSASPRCRRRRRFGARVVRLPAPVPLWPPLTRRPGGGFAGPRWSPPPSTSTIRCADVLRRLGRRSAKTKTPPENMLGRISKRRSRLPKFGLITRK